MRSGRAVPIIISKKCNILHELVRYEKMESRFTFNCCLASVIALVKAYDEDQHLLLHPKEWYTADPSLPAAYVNGTTNAVFVEVSVYWAEAGFVNFTTAVVTDYNGNVLANDTAFNMVVASGQSATLRVNCNCPITEKAMITLTADGWGTLSREVTRGNPASA